MTDQFRTNLIAIFIRRGHKGKEIVEMVREIEALLDGQRCEWTGNNYKGFIKGCSGRYIYRTQPDYCEDCGLKIEVKDEG